jgi:hypothetical protein
MTALTLTDGTTTIDLLATAGWKLADWTPAYMAYKGGGVWNDSALADGAAMAMDKEADLEDTFSLVSRHATANNLYDAIVALERLLRQGVRYWTTPWQATPVWLTACEPNETGTRYAIVKGWRRAGFAGPFGRASTNTLAHAGHRLDLTIIHGAWQEGAIGTEKNIAASAVQVWQGTTFGRVATTAAECFIANKANYAQLTHNWSKVSGGAWSANLVASSAYNMLNNTNDGHSHYFLIEAAAANSGPFCTLVFDNANAVTYAGPAVLRWEYWNGAAWADLVFLDDTRTTAAVCTGTSLSFQRTGVNSVRWEHPVAWATVDVNGVVGWAIRFTTELGGGTISTVPAQQNRPVYTCVWPNVQVAAAEVGGDLPMRTRLRIWNDSDAALASIRGTTSRYIIAMRSVSRENPVAFTPFLNLADTQNDPNLTVSLTYAPGAAFAGASGTLNDAAVGRWVNWVVPVAGTESVTLTLNDVLADPYSGIFHAYLRYIDTPTGTDGFGDVRVRLNQWAVGGASTTTVLSEGPWVNLYHEKNATAACPYIADLGRILLQPNTPIKSTEAAEAVYQSLLAIEADNTTAGTVTIKLLDLALMPADECLLDTLLHRSGLAANCVTTYLDVDSATKPYYAITATTRRDSRNTTYPDQDLQRWLVYASKPAQLVANRQQNIWVLGMNCLGTPYGRIWQSYPTQLHHVQVTGVRRYSSHRGSG